MAGSQRRDKVQTNPAPMIFTKIKCHCFTFRCGPPITHRAWSTDNIPHGLTATKSVLGETRKFLGGRGRLGECAKRRTSSSWSFHGGP